METITFVLILLFLLDIVLIYLCLDPIVKITYIPYDGKFGFLNAKRYCSSTLTEDYQKRIDIKFKWIHNSVVYIQLWTY